MVTDSGVATVSERAGTTIADPSDVIRVSAENTSSDSAKSKKQKIH